jgi:hypothetical protein
MTNNQGFPWQSGKRSLIHMADKRPESPKPIDPEKLDAIILKIIELANTYGDITPADKY